MDRDIGYFLSDGRGPAPPVITGPWEYVTIRGFGDRAQLHRMRLRLDPGNDLKINVNPAQGSGDHPNDGP